MLYIILPFHNRRNITERFLKSLKKQKADDFKLLLVDDGSQDGTADMALGYYPDSVLISGEGEWWWGGCLHQAYKWVRRQNLSDECSILIVNDDVELPQNFLQIGLRKLQNEPESLILAKAFSRTDKSLQDSGVHINWKTFCFSLAATPEEINILSTRGLFLKARVFLKIGGFHPILIPHYQSDYEFTHRAYKKGFKLCAYDELFLLEDPTQTSPREVVVNTLRDFRKKYFTKKSTFYLPSWIAFIVFSCPWRWIPVNLYRIFRNACRDLTVAAGFRRFTR
jgi:GT2 family glycosyltransferase